MRQLQWIALLVIVLYGLGMLGYVWLMESKTPLLNGLILVYAVTIALSAALLNKSRLSLAKKMEQVPPMVVLTGVKNRLEQLGRLRQWLFPLIFVTGLLFLASILAKMSYVCGVLAGAINAVAFFFGYLLLEQWVTLAFYKRVSQ